MTHKHEKHAPTRSLAELLYEAELVSTHVGSFRWNTSLLLELLVAIAYEVQGLSVPTTTNKEAKDGTPQGN
jgi:hypothetical protein